MDISGIWYNELGSQVEFVVNGSQLTGRYQTTVGNASGYYALVGQINLSGELENALGFVIVWQNEQSDSNSVTAWSGQAQEVDGEEVISTMWLLTSETDVDADWESTLIGKDVFTRNPQVKKNTRKAAKPFPTGLSIDNDNI